MAAPSRRAPSPRWSRRWPTAARSPRPPGRPAPSGSPPACGGPRPAPPRRCSPASTRASGTCLVLDGRIDNAAEVRAALGPDRELLRDRSDAELVLRAFLRWGTDAFARLIGDFAVVAWDAPRQELVAARDPMAQRPLHYLRDRRPGIDALRVASEPVGVLADRGIAREPNPAMVAMHLAGDVTSTTDTFFTGAAARPARPRAWWPASTAPCSSSPRGPGTRPRRCPDAGPRPSRTRSTSPSCGPSITTTVAEHLDAPDPIAAELSGGVDSSTVVGFASEALRAAGRPGLELVSLVMPGPPVRRDLVRP